MFTTILAYFLIGLFFVLEGRGRIGPEAKSLERGTSDRGSTSAVGAAFGLAGLVLLAAPLLNYIQLGNLTIGALVSWLGIVFSLLFAFSALAGWLGILIALVGLALRFWAFRTLGRFYTRTLRTADHQPIVQAGPYRWIRHPGYLGTILIFTGAALATTNWLVLGIVALAMFMAYYYRIQAEETMLVQASNQEYGKYASHTWRLIPFVY